MMVKGFPCVKVAKNLNWTLLFNVSFLLAKVAHSGRFFCSIAYILLHQILDYFLGCRRIDIVGTIVMSPFWVPLLRLLLPVFEHYIYNHSSCQILHKTYYSCHNYSLRTQCSCMSCTIIREAKQPGFWTRRN